jgi:ribosomal protein S12 methylthiotransferase accessory factor
VTALGALVSEHVGIVRSLDELMAGTADPPLPTFSCDVVADGRLLGAPLAAIGGVCGIGLDRASATGAALGETAERYSLCHVPPGRLVQAPADRVAGAVAPSRFGLFSVEQYADPHFPFGPFGPHSEVPWVDAWDVRTGALAWLPAELVYLGDPVPRGGRRIAYATSSGAACAPTLDGAVLKGLLELLERDAFMIAWACRLTLPLVDWRGHRRLRALDERYFRRTGLEYAVVDLSSFHGVPSVFAVVRAPRSEAAALGVGAGTAATIEAAWWKALSEAFACRAAAARLTLLGRGQELAPDGADVVSFDDHVVFYAPHDRAQRTRFLDRSAERVPAAEIAPLEGDATECIARVLDRIERVGSSAYAVEATAPDIAALGVHVVKTVAPELCMLDVPHRARFLGNPRLLSRAASADAVVNADPHPFP